ncbi:hypothetical protein Tco_0638752, partial [Tanacetum coccineum]
DPGASQRGYKSSMLGKSLETKEGDNRASLVDETLLDKGFRFREGLMLVLLVVEGMFATSP